MAISEDTTSVAPADWETVQAQRRPNWEELERFLSVRLKDATAGRPGQPKYKLLQLALADAIRQGIIDADSLLPTETALTAITPFSLGTVQRALTNLVREGLVARKPGVGTIVLPLRRRLHQPLHTRFFGEDGNAYPVYTEVLSRRKMRRDGPWRAFLGDTKEALAIRRRLNVGRRFAIYNEFFLDGARYPAFRDTPKRALNGVNFKVFLAREFSLAITSITHRMCVAPAPAEAAKVLDLAADTLCLRMRALAHLSERPLYFQEYWIPPSVPELVIESSFEQLAET
ncbi:MAG: GntR family transcriptional regulator [Geminicoccaceae bacterium]